MAMKSKKSRLKDKKAKKKVDVSKRAADHKTGSGYLNVPNGAKKFVPKEDDEITVDVVPYRLSKRSKLFTRNDAAPGETYPSRDFFVHNKAVGPSQESVICAAKTFGKPCYVCEWANKHQPPQDASEQVRKDFYKKYNPQQRQLWNFRVAGQEDRGCQFIDQSIKMFGEAIYTKVNSAKGKRAETFKFFSDEDDGCSIIITPKKKSGGDFSFVSCEAVEFTDREEPVGEEWVEKAHCFDDLVPMPDYEKVKEMMLAGGKEDAEDSDDDGGDSDDLPEAPCEKGDKIEFTHQGKTKKGKCVKVDEEEAEVTVKVVGGSLLKIDFDDVILPEADEDEDSEGEGEEGEEKDDNESDDDDLEESDEDDEGNDPDEDDEGDENEDDEVTIDKGDTVTWISPKSGKELEGIIKALNRKNGVALIETAFTKAKKKPPIAVDIDILQSSGMSDDEDEEIEVLSAKKKPKGKSAKKTTAKKKREVIDDDEDDD